MVLQIAADLPVKCTSFEWAGKISTREEAESGKFKS